MSFNLNQHQIRGKCCSFFVHFFNFNRLWKQLWPSLPPLCFFSLSWFALHAFSWQTWLSSLISSRHELDHISRCASKFDGENKTNMARRQKISVACHEIIICRFKYFLLTKWRHFKDKKRIVRLVKEICSLMYLKVRYAKAINKLHLQQDRIGL